jgi:predicted metalloprotease
VKWRDRGRSRDLEDLRGRGGGGGLGGLPIPVGRGSAGIGGLLVLLVVFFLGRGLLSDGGGGDLTDVFGDAFSPAPTGSGAGPEAEGDLVDFVSFVFDDAQNVWVEEFQQADRAYDRARLVLFDAPVASGCGGADPRIGPHYCPTDETVFVDLSFFRELRTRFAAPGDFAQAYVIAHEIGHHVQQELGISDEVRRLQRDDPSRANEYSVRLELQADCLAGVWAHTTYERGLLEAGDLEEGLRAAESVGDDRLQREATGRIDRESWTHGSSDQRRRWFATGYESGDADRCDTFETDQL